MIFILACLNIDVCTVINDGMWLVSSVSSTGGAESVKRAKVKQTISIYVLKEVLS